MLLDIVFFYVYYLCPIVFPIAIGVVLYLVVYYSSKVEIIPDYYVLLESDS